MSSVLIFMACLATAPTQCVEVSMVKEFTNTECAAVGQYSIEKWFREHPDYVRHSFSYICVPHT